MPKSITEAAKELPPVERPEEKRIRELAAKPSALTPAERDEAVKLLLGARAVELARSRRRAP